MTPLETDNQPLFKFLRYLQKSICYLTNSQNNNYTEEEKWRLGRLGEAAEALIAFAEEIGDRELCLIADDFVYSINKTSMGSPFKHQSTITRFAHRLDEYETKVSEMDHAGARIWRLE